MQASAMFRLMATLSGDDSHSGSAQDGWLVYLDSVCSQCGAARATVEWDEMWNTCAPCGRRLDCGSENSMLPPECRECSCGTCGDAYELEWNEPPTAPLPDEPCYFDCRECEAAGKCLDQSNGREQG